MDNTLLTGPVEQDSAAPKRLNSLLPQVSAEVMDKLLAEVQAEPDPVCCECKTYQHCQVMPEDPACPAFEKEEGR